MNQPSNKKIVEDIASIIGNQMLASAIYKSLHSTFRYPCVYLVGGGNEWDVFKNSLNAAIRNIEEHPRGKLFRRLIEYGPHNPDDPKALVSDGKTTLSDFECGSAIQFIFYHMINRFKGELAELLALEPCIKLIRRLQQCGQLPSDTQLYWSEMVQERRRIKKKDKGCNTHWGSFAKGADGLLAVQIPVKEYKSRNSLRIHGIVEVKSMALGTKKVLDQIDRHILRLEGGVKLGGKESDSEDIQTISSNLIRIMVMPSTWRLSREWQFKKSTSGGKKMVFPRPKEPLMETQFDKLKSNLWKITLPWSQEVLEQAAYEMTFWYMSQVGKQIYKEKAMPKGWEAMTPEQAGYNAIKMMLYYMPLRFITKRQESRAIKLYNVYSFGYPLGVDSKEMLWPEDFSDVI